MSELSCESVDFSHLDHLESLESKKNDEVLVEYRGITEISNESLALFIKDHRLIEETLKDIKTRKGVSKHDVIALESLRPRYPVLDDFIKNHPIQMYTTESSDVMYDVSMENFIVTAGKALWRIIKAIGKWVYNLIKNLFLFLTGQADNSAKINAKLSTQVPIISYINFTKNNLHDVPVIDRIIKTARDVSNQTLNGKFDLAHLSYYENSADNDALIQTLTSQLVTSYNLIQIDMSTLIKEMTTIEDPNKVSDLKDKYDRLLIEDKAIKLFITNTTSVVNRLKPDPTRSNTPTRTWANMAPGAGILLTALGTIPVFTAANASAAFTPKMYNDVFDKGRLPMEGLSKDVIKSIKEDLPRLVRTAGSLSAQYDHAHAKNQDVENALLHNRIGGIMDAYRQRITYLAVVSQRLEELMRIRSTVTDTMITCIVTEAKTISKGVGANRKLLSVKNAIEHDRLQKIAVDAIKSARI